MNDLKYVDEASIDIDIDQATKQFIPELGHIAFGQPRQEHEVPEYLVDALAELSV